MRRPRQAAPTEEELRRPHLPTTPDELKAYIPYLLNRLTSSWNIDQNRALAEYSINVTVLRTLSVLHIHKTLTVNEIASYAIVEQSNASRTIDSMVADGLVEREIAETDLRRRKVALTRKGERLLNEIWPLLVQKHQKLVGDIPARDLKACAATLLAMIRNMGQTSD